MPEFDDKPVTFRELSKAEIEAVLMRNKVGRLAFSLHDRVHVQPLHNVYESGWIYGLKAASVA